MTGKTVRRQSQLIGITWSSMEPLPLDVMFSTWVVSSKKAPEQVIRKYLYLMVQHLNAIPLSTIHTLFSVTTTMRGYRSILHVGRQHWLKQRRYPDLDFSKPSLQFACFQHTTSQGHYQRKQVIYSSSKSLFALQPGWEGEAFSLHWDLWGRSDCSCKSFCQSWGATIGRWGAEGRTWWRRRVDLSEEAKKA